MGVVSVSALAWRLAASDAADAAAAVAGSTLSPWLLVSVSRRIASDKTANKLVLKPPPPPSPTSPNSPLHTPSESSSAGMGSSSPDLAQIWCGSVPDPAWMWSRFGFYLDFCMCLKWKAYLYKPAHIFPRLFSLFSGLLTLTLTLTCHAEVYALKQ